MIWKIENISDSIQPVDNKILKNTREMVMSLAPGREVSQETCSKILTLINNADREQHRGQNRTARKMLREAFRLLSEMDCQRRSEPDKHANTTVKSKSWSEKYLERSLSKLK